MYYKLKNEDIIKSEVADCPVYINSVNYSYDIDLTEQEKTARTNFFPYLQNKKRPEKIYIETDDILAFKPKGESSGLFLHMIILPKLKHGYDKENDKILLKSVKDLTDNHKFLIDIMKKETFKFITRNRLWFHKNYRYKNTSEWLKKVHFGFHYPPTVGYLHMHVIIGPLTKHGIGLTNRWVKI